MSVFDLRSKLACPFCGQELVLDRCPVVATNFEEWDGGSVMPSGAKVLRKLGPLEYPVIAEATRLRDFRAMPLLKQLEKAVEYVATNRDAHLGAPLADLPARLCTNCFSPLPADIGEREYVTIGLAGVRGAGKTHLIATMIREACYRQGMARPGFDEFSLEESSAMAYAKGYYDPLFQERQTLPGTERAAAKDVRFRPMVIRARARGHRPFGILIHDVAGEVFANPSERARYADFLIRADGLMFLVDPSGFDVVRDNVMGVSYLGGSVVAQSTVFNGCFDRIPPDRKQQVPLAVVLSKSDLAAAAIQTQIGRPPTFAAPPPTSTYEEWGANLKIVDLEVRWFLQWAGVFDILEAAAKFPQVSFHAAAPLGFQPDGLELGQAPDPRRVLDPLVTLLSRIAKVRQPAA
jgi:hypothetical protein